MARVYFDCFNGVSGDMTLGALADLGAPIEWVAERLERLVPDRRVSLRSERIKRAGILGTRVTVEADESGGHRHLKDVCAIVNAADLPPGVKGTAKDVFRRLAEAEAHVHGSTPEKIHFHEVGALDAIVDVVGSLLLLEALEVTSVSSSAVTVGFGTVECVHGVMPVPAPATIELLKGLPIETGPIQAEMATPTGAALLATLCGQNFGAIPENFRAAAVGYGAGGREFAKHPNMLRALLDEGAATQEDSLGPIRGNLAALPVSLETLTLLQTDTDDASGALVAALVSRLYEQGAREVHVFPSLMKKGRPGHTIEILADPSREALLCETLFRERITLGVRLSRVERASLPRTIEEIDLRGGLGKVRAKVGYWGHRPLRAAPEFDDCVAVARESGWAVAAVLRRAEAAAAALVESSAPNAPAERLPYSPAMVAAMTETPADPHSYLASAEDSDELAALAAAEAESAETVESLQPTSSAELDLGGDPAFESHAEAEFAGPFETPVPASTDLANSTPISGTDPEISTEEMFVLASEDSAPVHRKPSPPASPAPPAEKKPSAPPLANALSALEDDDDYIPLAAAPPEPVVEEPPAELVEDVPGNGAGPASPKVWTDRQALAERCAQWRAEKKRVVFANGCFDCLHGGHVSYLEDAALQGDILIAAVNDDESTRALKGPGRPIYPIGDRLALLAAMECVDAVIGFREETCAPLLEALRPAVHSKGTDYTSDTVPERETAERLGVEIHIAGPPKENASRKIIEQGGEKA